MLPLKPLRAANCAAVVGVVAAAAVDAVAVAAVAAIAGLLLLPRVRVRPGSVQGGVHCCMLPWKPLQVANVAAVAFVVVVAAVVAAASAAVAELLLLPRARVQPGSVQNGVHVSAPRMKMCTAACARLGRHGSVRAAGAGQWVQGGLAEPPSGARGPRGVARRRAWAARVQRHPPFAVFSFLFSHLFSMQRCN